jgi:hypothetical protein
MSTLFDISTIRRTATFSVCGLYRYQLGRIWDDTKPMAGWIMLNPSTADASQDDPTIRRVITFSRCWGYGGAAIRNLFALRSTDPKGLLKARDPIGPDGFEAALEAVACRVTIVAWGKLTRPEFQAHAAKLLQAIRDRRGSPICLGINSDRTPKHPLYLRSDVQPILYTEGRRS